MLVYRIEREKYLSSTLTGIGASVTKGYRWNSLQTKLVYTAESRALATLEVSVHLDLSQDLPLDRYYIEIEIPDDIIVLEVNAEDLPPGWDDKPPTIITQIIGDDFVTHGESAVLKVPSSIVHQESNYLINPNHPDAKRIRIRSTSPMVFDSRLSSMK
jgi:RES domain-containing protein